MHEANEKPWWRTLHGAPAPLERVRQRAWERERSYEVTGMIPPLPRSVRIAFLTMGPVQLLILAVSALSGRASIAMFWVIVPSMLMAGYAIRDIETTSAQRKLPRSPAQQAVRIGD